MTLTLEPLLCSTDVKSLTHLQGSDSLKWRVLDNVISSLTGLIATSAFYGTWTGLDFIFAATDKISPNQKGLNGAYCYVCKSNTLPRGICNP